ncbi:MAG: hypothetical protein R2856_38815 [Caldilineaceae bacterium]
MTATRSCHAGSCRRILGDAGQHQQRLIRNDAYPSVQANFPTVFSVAAPERWTALHEQPRPFLGKRVSPEVEADPRFRRRWRHQHRSVGQCCGPRPLRRRRQRKRLSFQHRRIVAIPVMVTITPQTLPLLPNGIGYLNVWVDSNRDGDWAIASNARRTPPASPLSSSNTSSSTTPSTPTPWAGAITTGDHQRAGVVARRSGTAVLAKGPRSATARRTSRSSPTATGAATTHALPHRRNRRLSSCAGRSSIPQRIRRSPSAARSCPTSTPRSTSAAGSSAGSSTTPTAASSANNVHVIDSYGPPQILLAEHSIPPTAAHDQRQQPRLQHGTLPAGGGGLVILRTSVPWTTPPGNGDHQQRDQYQRQRHRHHQQQHHRQRHCAGVAAGDRQPGGRRAPAPAPSIPSTVGCNPAPWSISTLMAQQLPPTSAPTPTATATETELRAHTADGAHDIYAVARRWRQQRSVAHRPPDRRQHAVLDPISRASKTRTVT